MTLTTIAGLIFFAVATVDAACTDYKTCATCAADATCGFCDAGTYTLCGDASTLQFACTGTSKAYVKANVTMCPDPCVPGAATASRCLVSGGWQANSAASCNAVNTPPTAGPTTTGAPSTATTGTPSACTKALVADGTACAAAIYSLSCTSSCQKCTTGNIVDNLKVCKSVCDALADKCPTAKTACVGDASYIFANAFLCATNETNCVTLKIDADVKFFGGGDTPTTAAGGTTAPGSSTKCADQTSCTKCTTNKCQWCSLGQTSETNGVASCFETSETCPSAKKDSALAADKCVYDLNNLCEGHDCTACLADTTNKCVWCDTLGAATGSKLSSGSCNKGPECKTSVKPSTKCASVASLAFSAVALIVAFVACL